MEAKSTLVVMPCFSIVTPCLNAEEWIGETVDSVLGNCAVTSGEVDLQYLLQDGGSRDDTLKIVRRRFESCTLPNVSFDIHSEKDRGMYDALAGGLANCTGEYRAWINAGDLYSPHAFSIAREVMDRHGLSWLAGTSNGYNEKSHLTGSQLPFRYRRSFLRRGLYGTRLPFVQQASIFWRSELQEQLDLEKLRSCRLAGDYLIWKTFSMQTELSIVEAWLGGHRTHQGQLSEDMDSYLAELKSLADPTEIFDDLRSFPDRLAWFLPAKFKKAWNPNLYRWNSDRQEYC